MKTANFMCPFDHITRQTILPVDKEGQSLVESWWHLSREKGNWIICQVRAPEEVVAFMQAAPDYQWLEDVSAPGDEVKPSAPLDAAALKDWVSSEVTSFAKVEVDKFLWDNPEKAIESVVKLHGQTLENYRAGGLGYVITEIEGKAP
jgi:hypothetical protein